MDKFIVIAFILCGFLYGASSFKLNENYGTGSTILGKYILFLKWWNISIEYYTYGDDTIFTLNFIVPLNFSGCFRKYIYTRKNGRDYHYVVDETWKNGSK